MTRFLIVLIFLIVTTNSKSINSDHNVTKRESNDDLFPDWVPFKNKHGDELGEFVTVAPKKVKKRLALPVNFVLRSIAAPQDDYGQGESDSDDYYERKEWADPNRHIAHTLKPVNHTQLSDIDSIVTILNKPVSAVTPKVKHKEKPMKTPRKLNAFHGELKVKPKKIMDDSDYEDPTSEKRKQDTTYDERSEEALKRSNILDSVDELKEKHALQQKAISEKSKEEAMYKEEKEREGSVLEPHDKYNRKAKPSEYEEYEEEAGEDKYKIGPLRRPSSTTPSTTITTSTLKNVATFKPHRVESGKFSVFSYPNLYVVNDEDVSSESTTRKTSPGSTVSSSSRKSLLELYEPEESIERAPVKFSSKITSETPARKNKPSKERISLVPVDKELKEGEPTMFFPKRRKSKRKRKNPTATTTAQSPRDSILAGSNDEKQILPFLSPSDDQFIDEGNDNKDTKTSVDITTPLEAAEPTVSAVAFDPSGFAAPSGPLAPSQPEYPSSPSGSTGPEYPSSPSESAGPESNETDIGTETKPTEPKDLSTSGASAPIVVDQDTPTASGEADTASTVNEPETASTEHKKGEDNFEHEKGGEKEHHSEYQSEHGESGKKAYEGNHKNTKTEKGHHDKEDHLGSYHDNGGYDKHHHDEKKHYGAHHHEEHGKKHAQYEESGKHSKGHSTKGSHDIHKKEEYEKKVEFFEEEGDSAEEEKHGGHSEQRGHNSGGKFKKGNLDASHNHHEKSNGGFYNKGGGGGVQRGHSTSGGHDSHAKHGAENYKKGGHEGGKKWIYHHGFPAKNANLVIIDRRADQLYHGPQYYG